MGDQHQIGSLIGRKFTASEPLREAFSRSHGRDLWAWGLFLWCPGSWEKLFKNLKINIVINNKIIQKKCNITIKKVIKYFPYTWVYLTITFKNDFQIYVLRSKYCYKYHEFLIDKYFLGIKMLLIPPPPHYNNLRTVFTQSLTNIIKNELLNSKLN